MTRRRMITWGEAGDSYFFAQYHNGGSGDLIATATTVDGDDNFYVVGTSNGVSSLWKLTKGSGFALALADSGINASKSIAINSADEIWITVHDSVSGIDGLIFEADTSYSIAQSKGYSDGSNSVIPAGIALDGTSSVFISCTNSNGTHGGVDTLILKAAQSDLSITWDYHFGDSNNNLPCNIVIDSSGDVYSATVETVTRTSVNLFKVTSAGALSWQRTLEHASESVGNQVVGMDGSDNVYIGFTTGHSDTEGHIAKYNSSGTIQWQRRIYESGHDIRPRGFAADSSDNVFVLCSIQATSGQTNTLIVKYNSSGTLQWANEFYWSGANTYDVGPNSSSRQNIQINSNDDVYVAVDLSGTTSNNPFGHGGDFPFGFLKVPGDGSKTGTHGDFTYATATATSASVSNTDAAGGLSFASASTGTTTPSPNYSAQTKETDVQALQ